MLDSVDLGHASHKKSTVPEGSGSAGGDNTQAEVLNKKAISIVHRVRDKLTGKDFPTKDPSSSIDVKEQVQLLIKQATSHENLCQCYIGWCPFW